MVTWEIVERQLRDVGCDYTLWGRTETRELPSILMQDEQIHQAVNGYYDGGFALLVVTNYRVLVVDKKPFLMTVDDLRYDMIAEVDYSARLVTAVLHIRTPMRTMVFTSWSMVRLRRSMNYIQQRVMEMREHDLRRSQYGQFTSTGQVYAAQPAQSYDPVQHYMTPSTTQVRSTAAENSFTWPIGEAKEDFGGRRTQPIRNPYTKVPLLARRRKYPSFY